MKRERTPIERDGGVLKYSRLLLYNRLLLHRGARNPVVCVHQLFCAGGDDQKDIKVFENRPSLL